jgi:hypothetical protein
MALYRYQQIPYGTVRIGRGITMDWSGNRISLTVNLEVSGDAATRDLANQIKQTIESVWNARFDGGYRIGCAVDVLLRTGGGASSSRSQIIISNDTSATNVSPFPTLYYASMNYHINDSTVNTWTPAHEFGHMLGLDDHYDEGTWSRIRDLCGYSRTTTVHPGWQGNIMATHLGVLERRNLLELFAIHASELVTIVEDYAMDFWSGLDRSIRNLYTGGSYF